MPDAHPDGGYALHWKTRAEMTPQIAEIVFWIAAAACAFAELAILRTVFAPHRSAESSAPIPHSPRGAEMLWAVIPAIVLATLFAATWRAIH